MTMMIEAYYVIITNLVRCVEVGGAPSVDCGTACDNVCPGGGGCCCCCCWDRAASSCADRQEACSSPCCMRRHLKMRMIQNTVLLW